MPFVRISLVAGKSQADLQAIADGVYQAMLATIAIPEGDRFQVIEEHQPGHLIADPTYMGIARSPDVVFIEITLKQERSVEQKKSLYRQIAGNLAAKPGLRKEDIMIMLRENQLEDWSFGNGEAQMAGERHPSTGDHT